MPVYVPFCQPGTAGYPTVASHASMEVIHNPACASVLLRAQKQPLLARLTLVNAVTTFDSPLVLLLGIKVCM